MRSLLIKIIIPLFFMTLAFSGCQESNLSSQAVEYGPILEASGKNGNLEFYGTVENTADYSVESVYVVILLKDSSGGIIETNSVLVTSDEDLDEVLEPSESATFFIPFETSSSSEVSFKDVEVYYDIVN